jgi:hypothetical protein
MRNENGRGVQRENGTISANKSETDLNVYYEMIGKIGTF